ncbi:hypothetical protein [Georgenia wutianyii]|nr:hypothetical protein [Georgenia wutianyii]
MQLEQDEVLRLGSGLRRGGLASDSVLAGDWDGDGADTLGVRRTP